MINKLKVSVRNFLNRNDSNLREQKIEEKVSFLNDECVDCGNSNIWGVADVLYKLHEGEYHEVYQELRCDKCSKDRNKYQDCMVYNMNEFVNFPKYTCHIEKDGCLIFSPSGDKRRVSGSNLYEKTLEIIENESPDEKFLVVFYDNEDILNVRMYNDTIEDFPIKDFDEEGSVPTFQNNIRPYEDYTFDIENFSVLNESEFYGKTIEEIREIDSVQVVEEYKGKYVRHECFKNVNNKYIGFIPHICPNCEFENIYKLQFHHIKHNQEDHILIEHRHDGCNVIIGEPNSIIFDYSQILPENEFINDSRLDILEIDDVLDPI